jgi:hypothetical protein
MAQVIITIPDNKVQQFRDAMWAKYPPPLNWTGTDLEWVQEWLTRRFKQIYHRGSQKSFDDDIEMS